MKKKIGLILLLVVTVLITGCSLLEPTKKEQDKEQEVSNEQVIKEEGYTVTLGKDFTKGEVDNFDVFYQNEKIGFTSVREQFDTLASININKDSTLKEYGEKIITANNILNTFEESEDGSYMYTTYTKIVTNPYYYYTVIKKGSDSFWLFNFFCSKDDEENELSKIEKYAATIKVE